MKRLSIPMLTARALLWPTLVVSMLAVSAGQGTASPILGDTVTAEVQFGGFTFQGPESAVVAAGIEFDFPSVDIDVSDLGVAFLNLVGGTVAQAETYLLTDLDFTPPGSVTGVGFTFSGLSLTPDVNFTGDTLSVTLPANTFVSPGAQVLVDFESRDVPEPAVLGLFGVATLGFRARLKARRATKRS